MKLSHKIYLTIVAALVVGSLFFIANHQTRALLEKHASTLHTIGELDRLEKSLDEQLMRAVFLLYSSYDRVQELLKKLRHHLGSLEQDPYLNDEAFIKTRDRIAEYRRLLAEKEQHILNFGTVNSVIKNSTMHIPNLNYRYLQTFDNVDMAYLSELAKVTSLVFLASNSFDEDFLPSLQQSVDKLKVWQEKFNTDNPEKARFNESFLAHARVFHEHFPNYHRMLVEAQKVSTSDMLQQVKKQFLSASDYKAKEIAMLSYTLAVAFIVTVLLIIYFLIVMDREHKALARLHNRLRQSATTDRVTGLRNRFALERDVQRAGDQGTLLLLNIDGFGRFNDFYGTAIGDLLLKRVAIELDDNLANREGIRIYRLGAAEFGVLCNKSDCLNSTTLAQDILALLEQRDFTIQAHEVSLGISIGSSSLCPLLETAHLALKAVKTERSKHLEYSPELGLDQKIERNLYVLEQLRHAITTDRVQPYFQPIYNLHTDRIEQYECLMRIIDDKGNLMMPNEFLPVAKEGRLYGELTRIMIEKCFALFLNNDFGFHLNLSINDILDPQVISLLFSRLEEHPSLGQRLTLELLESEQVDNYEVVAEFIREAKSHGCRIAIDDFGVGYSNISHILQLDIDNLKIDASLVKNLEHDHHAEVLVNSIIRLARQMSINASTAEYVHNAAVLEKVRAMGIDYAQGYAIGQPSPELMPA